MPLHEYLCLTCNIHELQVAGLDDHTAECTCGGPMVRLSDPFAPLDHGIRQVDRAVDQIKQGLKQIRNDLAKACAWCNPSSLKQPGVSHGICADCAEKELSKLDSK